MIDFYPHRRTTIHNLSITSSIGLTFDGVSEGLILPEELMRLSDIAPYERVIVTKQGGDNWKNRVYTIAIPSSAGLIEARGSLSHLLKVDDLCCIISTTYFNSEQNQLYRSNRLAIPMIDIRYSQEFGDIDNDLSRVKTTLVYADREEHIGIIDKDTYEMRNQIPRVMLASMISGLRVSQIERQCLELNAELPTKLMSEAGMARNQSIFVYNASRGGISAESYVVPNVRDDNVVISGALSNVADVGDIISEAAFKVTYNIEEPILVKA